MGILNDFCLQNFPAVLRGILAFNPELRNDPLLFLVHLAEVPTPTLQLKNGQVVVCPSLGGQALACIKILDINPHPSRAILVACRTPGLPEALTDDQLDAWAAATLQTHQVPAARLLHYAFICNRHAHQGTNILARHVDNLRVLGVDSPAVDLPVVGLCDLYRCYYALPLTLRLAVDRVADGPWQLASAAVLATALAYTGATLSPTAAADGTITVEGKRYAMSPVNRLATILFLVCTIEGRACVAVEGEKRLWPALMALANQYNSLLLATQGASPDT